ncbi:YdcF family protein [Pedobacter sp. GSP4]|uniref:YdcF family protein n=1 Tax=Pedobacter sp. GSP4 TaxID=3453716 RepID=UPI003EE83681
MIFILSKILLFLIRPFFWFCILLLATVFVKQQKTRKKLFSAAVIVLLFFSNSFLAGKAVNFYEPEFPTEKKHYDIAIVLGGFSGLNKRNNEIQFNGANDRLFQAISLYRQRRIKKILITSGNANIVTNEVKEADLVKKFLHDSCIPDSDVLIENQSRNTVENAKLSWALIQKTWPGAKTLVITSAWHIPRAKLIFSRFFKSRPDYLPTNYMGRTNYDFEDFIVPNPGAFGTWDLLFKEWIGLALDSVRG